MYDDKLDNLGEMDEFLGRHKLLKLTPKEVENLNKPKTRRNNKGKSKWP